MALEGSRLLTLDALSVQMALDGSRRIVGMVKAQARRTLPLASMEGAQGRRGHFSEEATKCVIEEASAQGLDAEKLLIEAGPKLTEAAWRRPMAYLLLGVDGFTMEVDDHS
jgi:hypothetical protein